MDQGLPGTWELLVKPPWDIIQRNLATDRGPLLIRGPLQPGSLASLEMSAGLCSFRPSADQHRALISLASRPDGLVFAATKALKIVAYVTFQKPDYPWWHDKCFPQLLELGSLETDPSWRGMNVAAALLESIFANPGFVYFDDYVIMALLVIHLWDLENSGLSAWGYRKFMAGFLEKFGFTSWETGDPEISEHPCNSLVVRVGKNISTSVISYFSRCCLDSGEKCDG